MHNETMDWLGSKRQLTVIERQRVDAGECLADSDGDCYWSQCPQEKDYQGAGCPRWLATRGENEDRGGG